jgi:Flp pilus assembly protein TadD
LRLSPYDPAIHGAYWILGTSHLFLGHVDEAAELLRKATTINPQIFFPSLWLAGALGLSGRIHEAQFAVAEALKLNPHVDSIARMRQQWPWGTPDYWERLAETVEIGLRRAGFAEE